MVFFFEDVLLWGFVEDGGLYILDKWLVLSKGEI